MLTIKKLFSQKTMVVFLTVGLILAVIFISASSVLAQANELAKTGAAAGLPQSDLTTIIGNIIKVVLSVLGIVAVILIIYAGFIWMTAGGSSEKVEKAKKILIGGAIGLLLIVSSYAIASFIINRLIGAEEGTGAGFGETLSGRLGSGAIYLVVTSRYPEPDDTIPRNSTLTVSFNQDLNCETAAPNFKLEKDGVAIPGVVKAVGNMVIFKPENKCPAPLDTLACQAGETCSGGTAPCRTGLADSPICEPLPAHNPPYIQSSCCSGGKACCGCLEPGNYKITIRGKKEGIKGSTKVMRDDKSWNFNVADILETASPEVESNLPQGDKVSRNVAVAVVFSKEIDPTTLKVFNADNTYESGADDINKATVKITAAGQPVSGKFEKITSKAFVFKPDGSCPAPNAGCKCFDGLAEINVELMGGADGIKDVNCNSLNCANGKCKWIFKTSNEVDLTPPQVKSVEPADKAEDIDRASAVTTTFSELIDPTSVNYDTFQLIGEVASDVSVADDTATLTTFSILQPEISYNAVVFGGGNAAGSCGTDPELLYGVKDLAGNALVKDYEWSFTTGQTINGGNPLIKSISPPKGGAGQCVTISGYNLGCCSNANCSSLTEAQIKKWDKKNCSEMPVQGKVLFYPDKSAEILKWAEINRADKCVPPNCPKNCGLDTCNVKDPDNCRSCAICYSSNPAECPTKCWCPTPAGYSPENEIVVRVPEGSTDKKAPELVPEKWISPTEVIPSHTLPGEPGEIKVIPAY